MATASEEDPPSPAVVETVNEIMKIYRSLPLRPTIEEIEAATSLLNTIQNEEDIKLDEISKRNAPRRVPEELFSVLQQARKTMVFFQSRQKKKDAIHLVQLDKMFQIFDDLIQRASRLVSGDAQNQKLGNLSNPFAEIDTGSKISDESLIKKVEEDEKFDRNGVKGLLRSSSFKASVSSSSGGGIGKLSSMKVAALIENSAKSGAIVLDLKGKMDQMELLPVSIGKLSALIELDLSENKITSLPPSIDGLKALRKLDLHSNQLTNLPDTFGELINLIDLDLHANRLTSLPSSFKNLKSLVTLDLRSNQFTSLPLCIGNLTSLKRLNAEINELEELPYTIGSCSSLVELRLDFNQLKALPEAIGRLESLEILTLHYNRIKGLPTTLGNLLNLKELDLSFNELELIPESLCFAVNLRKLNIGKNFADLRALPRAIGNLELLEELDISANQITVLPDSFKLLSKLVVFNTDENPLEEPPIQVLRLGAQAVVRYMANEAAKREAKSQPATKKKLSWLKRKL